MRKQATTYSFRYTGKAGYRARRSAKVLPVIVGMNADGSETLTAETYAGMNLPYGFQKSRYRRPKDLYLVNGWVCEIVNAAVALNPDGSAKEWRHAFRVVAKRDGRARFAGFGGSIEVRDGLIQATVSEDGERTEWHGETLLALQSLGIRYDFIEGPYARAGKAA